MSDSGRKERIGKAITRKPGSRKPAQGESRPRNGSSKECEHPRQTGSFRQSDSLPHLPSRAGKKARRPLPQNRWRLEIRQLRRQLTELKTLVQQLRKE